MAADVTPAETAGRWTVPDRDAALADRYGRVRQFSRTLCEPLIPEDFVIQSMPDVSPTKWHLAHTTWFFETFVLEVVRPNYQPFHPAYRYLFNSYYNALGPQWTRSRRGVLSRPSVSDVFAYRRQVDEQMEELLRENSFPQHLLDVIEIGLHHEQQHQELMLMDIKHVFSCSPLHPVYRESTSPLCEITAPLRWIPFEGGLAQVGHTGDAFAYDNEGPAHRVWLEPFELGSRLITNGEYLHFIDDGGYTRHELWLSDGWNTMKSERWSAPLYWESQDTRRESSKDAGWKLFTLAGLKDLDPAEPVCHVSFYEADAFARWAGASLPTEEEWEVAARTCPLEGNFVESGRNHPVPTDGRENICLAQMLGDVWEWTASPYRPYPGYRPAEGALGEYNGKFMCNQMVLRGGCCATSITHIRPTYRNFFPPAARWAFSGIRLARNS